MAGQHEDDIAVTPGSGNVFADLGVAEPEEELAKAQLAVHIRDAIKRRRLTQAEAARLVGLDQPKISALMNGRLTGFSSDRLLRCLTALGRDVDIVVRSGAKGHARGHLRVIKTAA
ncbi:MAG: XRE family transcriptional regulator [Rhodospirillales bacterium]|nr:XRE family transcriptional regulator [Rhodospirillales bacterium]